MEKNVELEPEWVEPEREAQRWEVPAKRVGELVSLVEEEKRVEVELKIRRREQELLAYLRNLHDREATVGVCNWLVLATGEVCGRRDFETWDELSAHVRMHLLMDTRNEQVVRAALKDADSVLNPSEAMSFKVSAVGEDRADLLEKVSGALARRLAAKTERRPPEPPPLEVRPPEPSSIPDANDPEPE